MHDRFGYYIFWGVSVWIPAFYTLTGLWLVRHPIELSGPVFMGTLALGLLSIYINYEADAQRHLVRQANGKCLVWNKKPNTILATYKTADGVLHQSILLTSGWWGVSRHFHYVPELLLTLSWSVPAEDQSLIPYLYIIYLTVLLVHRSGRDEIRCREKYGVFWDEYCRRVPFKIIPGVY